MYGGANRGLMGTLADAVLKEGGHVMGIIPEALVASYEPTAPGWNGETSDAQLIQCVRNTPTRGRLTEWEGAEEIGRSEARAPDARRGRPRLGPRLVAVQAVRDRGDHLD